MLKLKVFSLDGCGGCHLEIIGMKHDILQLFDITEFVVSNEESQHVDIGLVVGHYNIEIIKNLLKCCDKLIIIGACANESYVKLSEELSNYNQRLYYVKGCPVSVNELVYTVQCIIKGIRPKQKNYPVCMECKENENICLLLKGMDCKGPITKAGCNAKCPSIGVLCRGCRGLVEGARVDLYEQM